MLIGFFKGQPNDYIINFSNGKAIKEGLGISFFYWKPTSTIVSIPCATTDINFIFNEMTVTYQTISIQGQVTYKVKEPKKLSDMLDFSINPKNRIYITKDPEKLNTRLVSTIQMITREEVQHLSLEEVLTKSQILLKKIFEIVQKNEVFSSLGIEIVNIYFTAVKPNPEISKALEADYRETLLKKADEAIYSRRAAAVEQEKKIKENELSSQISLENEREELIKISGSNLIKEAESKSKAFEIELKPYANFDPKILLAIGLKSLGDNAAKIGNLNITPELLSSILSAKV